MAPTSTIRSKSSSSKGGKSKSRNGSNPNNQTRISKKVKAPPRKQQKTKSLSNPARKKKKVYTEKELGIPQLNMITPVGVELSKGKKKGKVFVDDQESMMTILAIVNANKEGQIESKMMKTRQLEEIREARRKEAEVRQEQKKSNLEETKDSLRRKRKRKPDALGNLSASASDTHITKGGKGTRKRVSFA